MRRNMQALTHRAAPSPKLSQRLSKLEIWLPRHIGPTTDPFIELGPMPIFPNLEGGRNWLQASTVNEP